MRLSPSRDTGRSLLMSLGVYVGKSARDGSLPDWADLPGR